MRFNAIIFDLDGTLVDSLPGIELSAQHAVANCLPDRKLSSMRELIGPPIATMFARLWPDLSPEELQTLVGAFRKHYDAEGCRSSVPYDGVIQMIAELADRGVDMFVLTNKPLAPTLTILGNIGVRSSFREIVSPDSVVPPFVRKSDGAMTLRDRYALNPASTLLVGDGLDDMEAAEACGFAFAIAAYGYGSAVAGGANRTFPELKTFSELLALVL